MTQLRWFILGLADAAASASLAVDGAYVLSAIVGWVSLACLVFMTREKGQ